jgi:pyruvate formate lyase activating enzyme
VHLAKLAGAKGLADTVVTGGYIHTAPPRELCKAVDAFSISVKAYSEADYMSYAGTQFQPVKRAMETVRQSGCWLEVVVLVIPTISDDLEKMRGFPQWVVRSLGHDTPVHFDRFWPAYRLKNLPQTPQKTLENARALAVSEGVRYAYVGNLPGHWAASTYCPSCGKVVLRRVAFKLVGNDVKGRACKHCGHKIPGVGLG